jgi:hypothetical protein
MTKLFKLSCLILGTIIFASAIADQCPNLNKVLVNKQWATPDGWQTFPLSPLAGDTGIQKITAQGLTHVFYLTDSQTVRCAYNKKGLGAKDNTYVISKPVSSFIRARKELWKPAMDGVWGCFARGKQNEILTVDPKKCQWSQKTHISPPVREGQ